MGPYSHSPIHWWSIVEAFTNLYKIKVKNVRVQELLSGNVKNDRAKCVLSEKKYYSFPFSKKTFSLKFKDAKPQPCHSHYQQQYENIEKEPTEQVRHCFPQCQKKPSLYRWTPLVVFHSILNHNNGNPI